MRRKKAIAAVDAREASFDEWFMAQHGARPDTRSITEMADEAFSAKLRAQRLIDSVRETEDWDNRRYAALMAWQASKVQR